VDDFETRKLRTDSSRFECLQTELWKTENHQSRLSDLTDVLDGQDGPCIAHRNRFSCLLRRGQPL